MEATGLRAPDGFDITYCSNKKDIPKGYKYVQSFRIIKPDGNADYEIIDNGKIILSIENTNNLSSCAQYQLDYKAQKIIHQALNVSYPEKEYKRIFEKKSGGCKLK